MEAVNLCNVFSAIKVRNTELHVLTHHVEEDLVKFRSLQIIQTETVRVLGNDVVGKGPKHGQQAELPPVLLKFLQPDQHLVQVPPHDWLQSPHGFFGEHLGHGGPPGAMQVVIGRGARGLGEAKHLDHARILVPPTAAAGHELGQEGRVVDVQLVGGDAHDGTVFGVHVADAEEILAAAEEVMVEFAPQGYCWEERAGVLGQGVQSETVGVEEYDIEGKCGSDRRQWPSKEEIEGGHGDGGWSLAMKMPAGVDEEQQWKL